MVFINRNQKYIYRVIYDQDNKEFKMKTFPFEQGIAGYVGHSGITIFVDAVNEDIRFVKEIDDPKGNVTNQIVSVPIYCSSDRLDPSPHSLSAVPRGVISLINNRDPDGFSPQVRILFLLKIHFISRTLKS